MASIVLITAPSTEPVTLAEAKAQMRLESDFTQDDALITSYLLTARQWCEGYCKRQFITATYEWIEDYFPIRIDLPYPPVQSVTSITYTDDSGVNQTLSSSLYQVDIKSEPARIIPAYQELWPTTRSVMNAVTVRFVCGYGDANAVPQAIKLAILMLTAHFYEHRENVQVGGNVMNVPFSTTALLDPYRMFF